MTTLSWPASIIFWKRAMSPRNSAARASAAACWRRSSSSRARVSASALASDPLSPSERVDALPGGAQALRQLAVQRDEIVELLRVVAPRDGHLREARVAGLDLLPEARDLRVHRGDLGRQRGLVRGPLRGLAAGELHVVDSLVVDLLAHAPAEGGQRERQQRDATEGRPCRCHARQGGTTAPKSNCL
jgi:hypothetical protein